MSVSQEFIQLFEEERPEVCRDCEHLELAAKANYLQAIRLGGDDESATAAGLAAIDHNCKGMKKPKEQA